MVFPKRKLDQARAVSWRCSIRPWEKIEHCEHNAHLFDTAFGGIDRG
jgi:hypothetical protein